MTADDDLGRDDDAAPIDAARVARLFSRPRTIAADDFIAREVARRMDERLATIRIAPSRIADVGCGDGADLPSLASRYPAASIVGVDLAWPRVRRVRAVPGSVLSRWLRRTAAPVAQADFRALPFAAGSVDLLWSNLALHWNATPHRVLPEWGRVVATGGVVMFAAFGPDTLREVAAAFTGIDHRRHVVPFTDMHDYGDMLVAAGFTSPVVDMERLSLTYSTAESLWRDVRALGGNPLADRARGLHGRGFRDAVARGLDATRGDDGRYRLTFELIYAHAWKAEPRKTARGEAIVHLRRDRPA